MMTRNDLLGEAIDECIKDLYRFAVPHIEWDDFVKECKEYSVKYKDWEEFNKYRTNIENRLYNENSIYNIKFKDWYGKSITECIGPRPYEFYYLPKDITKDIVDSYIYAYKIDSQKELLDTIEILKNYCKEPIVDKYIDDYTDEHGNHHPGYRGYDYPYNLELELATYLGDWHDEDESHEIAEEIQDKFFEFLDMAGKFYNWNGELNSFSMSVYLGPSPNSNKERVIENWKQYRNKDIEINEEQIKKDYYGDNDE